MKGHIMFLLKLVVTVASVLLVTCILWTLGLIDLIPAWFTFLAILVALFRERLFEWYFRAHLTITASPSPEFAHEVDARDQRTGELVERQYWFGIRVENTGLTSAKNVEVHFRGLTSNVIEDFATYNTIPLIRSWVGTSLIKRLPRRVSTRWDVCCLHERHPDVISFRFKRTPNALAVIRCKSNQASYFEFEIITLADNANLQRANITMEFKGTYREGFTVR